jgi:formamidopyrimidine-DNA glycosylase
MPELPEVARVALTLNEGLKERRINRIHVHSGRYSRHGEPEGLEEFRESLPVKIMEVSFRGKFILFEGVNRRGNQVWIWNTLGMGGNWRKERTKHGHVEFELEDGGSYFFTDIRNFGTLKFVDSPEKTSEKLNSIGPDHLNSEITDSVFKSRLMKFPKKTLPEVLMDQSLIGGIGNYIKAEVLYRCKLSPHRTVESLSDQDFSNLNRETKKVVVGSFLNGGATLYTFENTDGERGEYSFELKVYNKSFCEMGFPVIRETTKDKRTTHWVPQIQK